MIDLSDCPVLGTITKTHGIRGQMVVRLNNLQFDDIIEMESVFLEIEGLPVPFFVEEYGEKTSDTLLLKLQDIDSADAANELVDARIFVPALTLDINDSTLMQLHDLKGYTVIDVTHGKLGSLDEILSLNENPLLRVLSAGRELLLPFHDEFVVAIDREKSQILVKTPEGLLDLSE